jgi:hypothetical protein
MAGDTDKADRSGRRGRTDKCAAGIVEQTEKLEPFAESPARLRVGKVISTAAQKQKSLRKRKSRSA